MNRSWLTSIGNRPRGKKLANSFSRFENKNRILSWNLPIKYFEMICWNVSWHLDRNSFFKNIYMHWYDKNDSNGKWIHRARGREKNFEMDKKQEERRQLVSSVKLPCTGRVISDCLACEPGCWGPLVRLDATPYRRPIGTHPPGEEGDLPRTEDKVAGPAWVSKLVS